MPHQGKRIEFRNVLSKAQKDALFQSAILDSSIYELIAKSNMDVGHFTDIELYLWYIHEVVHKFYTRQRRLPTKKELRLELEQRMDDPKDYLDDVIVEDITDFYKALKALTEPPLSKDTAREYLKQIFEEKAWRSVHQLTSERRKTPVSIPEALDMVKSDIAAASTLSAEPIPSPFDQPLYDPLANKSRIIPYGVPFIDAYLGGGGVPGEIYLLLGSTGSCKSTMLQQLSVSLAALQMAKWEQSNKRRSLGVSYFVSYEMPGWEIMARFYANFAQINVQKFFDGAPLSRNGNLSPDEQVLFAKAIEYGIRVPSEKERFEHARTRLKDNWRLVDFSGMSLNEEESPDPMKGSGLCPEIAEHIAADMEYAKKRGLKRHVAGIFIDYVGMMALRHCQMRDKDPSRHLRIVCASTPQDTRTYLSHRFKCPVFLAHQLNASAVKLKPGQIADKTEAQESKTLADNCNVVFVVSKPTEDEHRLVRMNRQKGRRMPGMGPCVLQVQGQYARVREVGALWSWDDITRQFLQNSSLDVPYTSKEDDDEIKIPKFDGQEFDVYSI